MAVAFRSASTPVTGTTSVTFTEPAGAADGDILIANIYAEKNADTATLETIPTGFTEWVRGTNTTPNPDIHQYVFWMRRSGAPPTLTFGKTSASFMAGDMIAVSGALASGDPADVVGTIATGTNSSATASAVTTTVANTLLCYFVGSFAGLAITADASMTERSDSTSTETATQAIAATGSTGTRAANIGTFESYVTVMVAIKPDTGGGAAGNPALDDSDAGAILTETVQAAISGSEASSYLATIEEVIPVSGATPVLDRPDEDADVMDESVENMPVNLLSWAASHATLEAQKNEEWAPPSGAAPVLERPDEDDSSDDLGIDVDTVRLAATSYASLLASTDEAEAIPVSGALPVLDRPDEDEDGAQLLPVPDTTYAAAQLAIEDAEVIPASGAAPVLERPDEEDEQVAQFQPALDTSWYATQSAVDDAEVLPVSGAAPVLERPDDDEDGACYLPAQDTSWYAAQAAIDDCEVIPVDGTVFVAGDAAPPEDDSAVIIDPIFDPTVAEPERIPVSGALPVLERADEDEDGAQLLPVPDTTFAAAQIAIEQDELAIIDGYVPPDPIGVSTGDEDALQPPLDTSWQIAVQSAVDDGEVIPVSGALNAARHLYRQLGGASVTVHELMGGGSVEVRGA